METRACSKCLVPQPLERYRFDRRRQTHRKDCTQCEGRRLTHYTKTPTGFLMQAYHNMQSRVRGLQPDNARYYKGLPILPRADFYAWARENADFWRLYKLWSASGYKAKLAPSVNRINPNEGYVLGNIEFITHALNAGLARHRSDAAFARIYAAAA